MSAAFSMQGVTKNYDEFHLGPIDLSLEPGIVLGFVGPNGSGKSTTMHLLMGLIRPKAGEIKIWGQPNSLHHPSWKHQVGYVGDVHVFYEQWSAEKNLKFLSQFYPKWSDAWVDSLCRRFDMPLKTKAKKLSTGNRVKLSLIAALAHRPRLLLLDEPTSGLDPVVRADVLDVLFEIVEDGNHSIFYSTHILSDISRLTDELAFIKDGSIASRVPKHELTDAWRRISFRLDRGDTNFESCVTFSRDGNDFQLISSNGEATLVQLGQLGAQRVEENRMSVEEIAVEILKGKRDVAAY